MIRAAGLCGALALLVSGCSEPAGREPAAASTDEAAALNEQIAGDMAAVRLKAAEDRIVQLERQVGTLENRPEKLDLQLLTKRVEALEARAYAGAAVEVAPVRRGDSPPAPTPTPTPTRFNPFGL